MKNFRVRDLNEMAKQLRAAKIEVTIDPEIYPNGRFARSQDREAIPSSFGSRNEAANRQEPGSVLTVKTQRDGNRSNICDSASLQSR
jgi:hypothetical protein